VATDNNGSGRRLLKEKALLRIFGISHSTFWLWRKKGIIPQPRVVNGRAYYFSDEVDASLSNLPTKPASPAAPDAKAAGKKRRP